MTRLEKIVAEQLKRGDIGTAIANSTLISKLKTKFKYGITVYNFIDRHGVGKKYPPLKADEVINLIPKNKGYKNYSNGEYVFVIDDQNPISGKKETLWNVYIINKKKTFPNISDQVFDENKSGQFDQSFIITFKQYDKLLNNKNKNTNLNPSITVGDLERELVKDNPAIEKTKETVRNVIKGTETIDPNNLGKGTKDAKAFQELLYLVGLKLIPGYTSFKSFVSSQLEAPDGGWAGDIGDLTLAALHQINGSDKERLTVKWNAGDKAGVIEELRKTLATVNESTNYFKGTGINTKLKDLIKEHLINEQGTAAEEEVYVPTNSTTTVTTTTKTTPTTTNTKKKTSSTNFTQATFPSKYNGSGTITYNNGDKFTGSWVNGLKSGKGKYTIAATKTTIVGNWYSGKKTGIITYTKDGTTTQQTWRDGKIMFDGIEDLYKESVASTQKILSKMVNYINNHKTFVGYKSWNIDDGDDEKNALIDLVKPYFQANIQPEVYKYYTKYIKPYMSQFDVSDAALTVEYDLKYVGTNNSVTNISNTKFRKIFQNYLVLKANSSNTALNHPTVSAAYYNYAGDKSSFTIPAMFYYNYARSVHYWSLAGGRAVFNVDTDF
jgi:hypothetical protein